MRALLLCGCLLAASVGYAESDYDRWLKRTQRDFKVYVEASDQQFSGYLEDNWKAIGLTPPVKRDTTPKPDRLPVAELPTVSGGTTPLAQVASPATLPARPAVEDHPTRLEPTSTGNNLIDGSIVSFDFYGHRLSLASPSRLETRLQGKPGPESIAEYWKKMSESQYRELQQQIELTTRDLQLNDWGTIQLIGHLAAEVHNRDADSQALLTWFLAIRCGFDARIAYSNNRIYLLLASERPVYGVTYFTIGKHQYYAFNYNDSPRYETPSGSLFTYNRQHESGKKLLGFADPASFTGTGNSERRTLAFSFDGRDHEIRINLMRSTAAYYASYPQLDLDYYAHAGLPVRLARELTSQLQPLLEGKSEQQAVNLLLRFTQTAFQYETDEQQFGAENYLFPQETLYYRYSDCEDRAILFSWLVKNLLGLDVVLVDYPGHVAAAVAFHGKVEGEAWQLDGKHYVVADPTYINANAGQGMPQFAGTQPSLRRL